jgi:hypothetical protein
VSTSSAIKSYSKETTKTIMLRFMLGTEGNFSSFVNSRLDKAGYIKVMIRADMANSASFL